MQDGRGPFVHDMLSLMVDETVRKELEEEKKKRARYIKVLEEMGGCKLCRQVVRTRS